jgi:hypothetical protein
MLRSGSPTILGLRKVDSCLAWTLALCFLCIGLASLPVLAGGRHALPALGGSCGFLDGRDRPAGGGPVLFPCAGAVGGLLGADGGASGAQRTIRASKPRRRFHGLQPGRGLYIWAVMGVFNSSEVLFGIAGGGFGPQVTTQFGGASRSYSAETDCVNHDGNAGDAVACAGRDEVLPEVVNGTLSRTVQFPVAETLLALANAGGDGFAGILGTDETSTDIGVGLGSHNATLHFESAAGGPVTSDGALIREGYLIDPRGVWRNAVGAVRAGDAGFSNGFNCVHCRRCSTS